MATNYAKYEVHCEERAFRRESTIVVEPAFLRQLTDDLEAAFDRYNERLAEAKAKQADSKVDR